MTIKDIADRLKNAHTWYEVKWIEAELRALDGKTVLPVEITQVIEDGDTLCVENGMDGGHSVGIVVASLGTGGEVVSAKTTEAAIDALAEELRKGKP